MKKDFFTSEFKKWVRDPMMRFMLIYPLLFGLIGRYLLPWAAETADFNLDHYADLALVALTLMTPHVYGAIIGFSILDDRDDNILTAVQVTPLSIHQFLSFRMLMVLGLSFASCVYVMWFSDIGDLSFNAILAISLLASLGAPMSGLLINALSSNKIEGFAVMKGTGIILMFPIFSLFFFDSKELLFSFAPGFWPAKAISGLVRGEELLYLSYNQYFFIGLAYIIILNLIMYRVFLQRARN